MRNTTAYIITSVRVNTIDDIDKAVRITHHYPRPLIPVESWEENDAVEAVTEELVQPFHVAHAPYHVGVNPFEEPIIDDYYIYLPLEVQESMGMLFDVWKDMAKEIDDMKRVKWQRQHEGWFKRVHRGMVNKL